MMADRVHVFGGSARLLEYRHILRLMARCLTDDPDVTAEESLAARMTGFLAATCFGRCQHDGAYQRRQRRTH